MDFNLTKSFKYSHFACKCGAKHPSPMNLEFVFKLQKMQDLLGDRFDISKNISSGFRCSEHNKSEGGAKSSFHLLGRAVDISVSDSKLRYDIARAAYQVGFGDISFAYQFIHVDDRDIKQTRLY
jgi:uncharacterized protein YcbK (DUF882 family)